MEDLVLYQTKNQIEIQSQLSDLICKFEAMQTLGYSMADIQKHFFKEELLALVFWYAQKAQNASNTEGVVSITNNDLFTDFETIN